MASSGGNTLEMFDPLLIWQLINLWYVKNKFYAKSAQGRTQKLRSYNQRKGQRKKRTNDACTSRPVMLF